MTMRRWCVVQYDNGFFVEEVIGQKVRMFGPFLGARALEEFLAQRRDKGEGK